MMPHHTVTGVLLGALSWLMPVAHATTTCTTTPSDLVFGNVTMNATGGFNQVDSSATVGVTCTTAGLTLLANVRVRMCLNIGAGTNGGGQTDPRRMLDSFSDPLQFQIYRDAARSQIWGDSNSGGTPRIIDLEYELPLLTNSGSTSATLYGRIHAQSGLAEGNYDNPFADPHTRLDYRYAEPLLGTPPWPASCTSGGGGGGSITFPFTASATVPASCVITLASDLTFGSVPGLITSNNDQTTSFNFTCTGRTPWSVGLGNGLNPTGSTRRMRQGATANYVQYELYTDSGRSTRWDTTNVVTGTGSGSSQTLTIHGRVLSGQAAPAGDYSDTVTITITY